MDIRQAPLSLSTPSPVQVPAIATGSGGLGQASNLLSGLGGPLASMIPDLGKLQPLLVLQVNFLAGSKRWVINHVSQI